MFQAEIFKPKSKHISKYLCLHRSPIQSQDEIFSTLVPYLNQGEGRSSEREMIHILLLYSNDNNNNSLIIVIIIIIIISIYQSLEFNSGAYQSSVLTADIFAMTRTFQWMIQSGYKENSILYCMCVSSLDVCCQKQGKKKKNDSEQKLRMSHQYLTLRLQLFPMFLMAW